MGNPDPAEQQPLPVDPSELRQPDPEQPVLQRQAVQRPVQVLQQPAVQRPEPGCVAASEVPIVFYDGPQASSHAVPRTEVSRLRGESCGEWLMSANVVSQL